MTYESASQVSGLHLSSQHRSRECLHYAYVWIDQLLLLYSEAHPR